MIKIKNFTTKMKISQPSKVIPFNEDMETLKNSEQHQESSLENPNKKEIGNDYQSFFSTGFQNFYSQSFKKLDSLGNKFNGFQTLMSKFLTAGIPKDKNQPIEAIDGKNSEALLKDYFNESTQPSSFKQDFTIDFAEGLENIHTKSINCLIITKDSKRLISGGDDETIKIWEIPTLKHLKTLCGHRRGVTCLAIPENEQETLFSGGRDGKIRIWNLQTYLEVKILLNFNDEIKCLKFTFDQKLIFSNERGLHVWDPENKSQNLKRINDDIMEMIAVTSEIIISAGKGIYLTDLKSFSSIKAVEGRHHSIDVTSDHKKLVSISAMIPHQKRIIIWDLQHFKEIESSEISEKDATVISARITKIKNKMLLLLTSQME